MISVADVMTLNPLTLSPMDSLKAARELMETARIRHIPIVSAQGEVAGVLTQRDVLKASVSHFADVNSQMLEEIESGIPVFEVMTTEMVAVPPHMPLLQAARILLKHKFGCLPVIDEGRLVGILTESDFVKLIERIFSSEK